MNCTLIIKMKRINSFFEMKMGQTIFEMMSIFWFSIRVKPRKSQWNLSSSVTPAPPLKKYEFFLKWVTKFYSVTTNYYEWY